MGSVSVEADFQDGTKPPVIDFSQPKDDLVRAVSEACLTWGCFVAVNHGINHDLLQDCIGVGHEFFDLPDEIKQRYDLTKEGAKWRGYMRKGGERSENGQIEDFKEGLYLGEEHSETDPRVQAGLPTFGKNVMPDDELPHMRGVMRQALESMQSLGDHVMDVLSLSLGLDEHYLQEHITEREPVVLPRMFRYPPQEPVSKSSVDLDISASTIASCSSGSESDSSDKKVPEAEQRWGIGRHSDYGLWTMILTDSPGLEFEHPTNPKIGWQKIPYIPNAIIMNVGDVLDRLTSGRFISAYHRARNNSTTKPRLSLPFFYDPCWEARMKTLPVESGDCDYQVTEVVQKRWSKTKIRCSFDGKVAYSEFLAKKVAKVFPDIVPKKLWENFESTTEPSTRHALVVHVPEKLHCSSLQTDIEDKRQRVLKHPLYEKMTLLQHDTSQFKELVKHFQEHHVWAVWDYFQLLKRLQNELTCTKVPWRPVGDRALRRFISEIVLEEESDEYHDGKTYASHLELYLAGMDESGANSAPMRNFLRDLESVHEECTPVQLAQLALSHGAPYAAAQHILSTLELAMNGSTADVAAVFAFGREDIIPFMFRRISSFDKANFAILHYYLERHIELDGKDHGPLAIKLVETMCGQDVTVWKSATAAVNHALDKRYALWDAVRHSI